VTEEAQMTEEATMTEEAQTATETGTMTKMMRSEPARRKRRKRWKRWKRWRLCAPKNGALRGAVYVFARARYLRAMVRVTMRSAIVSFVI